MKILGKKNGRYVAKNGYVFESISNKVYVELEGSALEEMLWDGSEKIELSDIDKKELFGIYEQFHGFMKNSDFESVKVEAEEVWRIIALSYGYSLEDYYNKANPGKDIKPTVRGKPLRPMKSPDDYTLELIGNKVFRLRPNPIVWKKENNSRQIIMPYVFYYDKNGNVKLAGVATN